jgi:serine/threonine protein kinase
MFEWADGGSLEDLWDKNPEPALSTELIKEAVVQLRGLAEALYATHNQENDVGIRHGDLKPENILRFQSKPESIFGTLKIGDWGLAKYHNTATVLRGENTTTKYGTPLYEPPEVEVGKLKILGRQYDIWSMGCIILELIIWLLYGYNDVKRFRKEVRGESKNQVPCYRFVSDGDGDQYKAKVHEIVVRWMDHMAEDPVCAADTAMGELLNLVRKRLLVVELPPLRGQTIYIKE